MSNLPTQPDTEAEALRKLLIHARGMADGPGPFSAIRVLEAAIDWANASKANVRRAPR